jgi:hypothetical protein
MEAKFTTIEEIRSTLDRLRQDPKTQRNFPRKLWTSIIQLIKIYPVEEVCRLMQSICKLFCGTAIPNQLNFLTIGKKFMCNKILIVSECRFYFFIRPQMKAPTHLDFTPEQIEVLIERLDKQALVKEDYRNGQKTWSAIRGTCKYFIAHKVQTDLWFKRVCFPSF